MSTLTEEQLASYIPLLTPAGLCDRNASTFGSAEAVVDFRRRLTWSDTSILSTKLALHLHKIGLHRTRPLLVQLPNCAELFLARLACEKAGVSCVTVSPSFKAAELKPIINHTRPGAAILFATYRGTAYYELLRSAGLPASFEFLVAGDDVPLGTSSLDEIFSDDLDPAKAAALAKTRLGPLDSCQIATTSGSTGTPKCVDVRLYARLLTASVHAQRFDVGQNDTLMPVAPIISGTSEALGYFGAALTGARVVLVDHFDPEGIFDTMVRERVTFACVVPTMLAKMAILAQQTHIPRGITLKSIATYGSRLPVSIARDMETLLGAKIVQAYGTMDYGGIAANCVSDDLQVRLGTVGRPLEGNEVIICDENCNALPHGQTGRIMVRGLHTVGKYYKLPELDQRKWQKGYFNVGEIGRFDDSGNLIVLGRSDTVIIRGGQNIYPEDIESLLFQHESVEEAAVIGTPDPVYGERICAFVALRRGKSLTFEQAVGYLKAAGVAHFKLPEKLEILPHLPKVATGQKIDKIALAHRINQAK